MAKIELRKIKTIHLAMGIDLLKSKMSLQQKPDEDRMKIVLGAGVVVDSATSDRQVLIPFSNIKGLEFYPEEAVIKE